MSRRLLNKITIKASIFVLVGGLAILLFSPFIAQAQDLTLGSVSEPFGNVSLAGFIAGLIRVFLGVVGVIMMVIFMYAGFTWMTAGGDPTKIDKAKKVMTGALIGLILTISAFGIASFLVNAFGLNGSVIDSGCEPGTVDSCVVGEYCPGTRVCNDLGMPGVCIKDDPGCGSGDDGDEPWYDIISSSSPVITYVSPAKDTEENNPAYGFLGSAAKDDIANGASGNYITISGRRFGNATGTVIFKNVADNTTTSASLADCVNSWRSNQIIVEVPQGLAVSDINYEDISSTTAPNYQIAVITAVIPETDTASATPSRISNYKGFLVNDITRPGICSATPSSGIYPATTTIEGNNFPISGVQNVVWSMRYFDSASSTWKNESITSTASNWTAISTIETLPENKKGRTSFMVYNGSEFSNYYAFLLSAGRLGDPCGYDSNACDEDVDTCITGLECQFCQKSSSTLPYYDKDCNPAKNCTCQSEITAVCDDGEEDPCSVGGCSGKSICVNGQWSACTADPGCVSYLGASTSTLAIFTWPFIARKNPVPGMDCSSALWNDGTCDLNGCISKDLFCKTEGSDQGFVEIYNPTESEQNIFLCFYDSYFWSKKAQEFTKQGDIENENDYVVMSGTPGVENLSRKIFSESLDLSAGNYSLLIRLKATNAASNSFMYRVPGNSDFIMHSVNSISPDWQWQKISFSLSQEAIGAIEIAWRETRYFDRIILVKGNCSGSVDVGGGNFYTAGLPISNYKSFSINDYNSGDILDSYFVAATSSAFYPYSFGRVADGDKGNFVYFSSSTRNASNGIVAVGENLSDKPIINEVSLSSDPCTCVQKGTFCKSREIDRKTCPKISNCDYVRVCDENGYFGACVKSDPNCIDYPIQATSTLSIFTWAFLASAVPPADAFQVVVDCSRSPQCLDSDMLPSPTPWPNEWNTSTHPGLSIEDELACTNSVISARFTMPISSTTLNSSTLKVFERSGTSWTQKTINDDQIQKFTSLGEGGSDTFQISGFELDAGANYRVLISKDVLSETGSNLIRNNRVVNAEGCATTSEAIMASSSVAFCWNIEVRASTDPCPVGCINCSPKNYFNRYFGQKRQHRASPISEDNVCLMLQESNYAWNWYEQHQTSTTWVQGTVATAYSALLNLVGTKVDVYEQSSGTPISGKATTTAQKESGWRNYVNSIVNYFKENLDFSFFKITAEEDASGHPGSCPAHNDFSSPIVVENQYCTNDEDVTKRILQSPSPWKGQRDACTNAVVFALFNRNMVDGTITSTDNIIVQKCNAGYATSTEEDGDGNCTEVVGSNSWTRNVFSYAHPDLSLQELMIASIDTDDTTKPDGIRLIPPEDFLFDENSWYRVIIKGGNDGVRGASTTASGEEDSDGTLVTPTIPGTSYFSNGRDDYFWYFKTGSEECPIENVAVLPQLRFLRYVGLTQTYNADPQAANCNHLNPSRYTWDWRSLISLNDETATCNANTGDVIATICDDEDVTCASTDHDESYISKAFAKEEGQVKIKARAENTRLATSTSCLDDKYGYGNLQIGYGGFRIISHGNTDCLNSDIYFNFSSDGKGESIAYGDLINATNKNVGLYKCNDNTEECISMTYQPLSIIRPQNSGTDSSNPYLTGNVILRSDVNLSTSTYYRVIVRGGIGGIKSFADADLEGLNYSINPNSGGEACDPTVYPWRPGDPDAGKCGASTCKFVNTSLCQSLSKECEFINATTTPYCNELCQKIGNSNIASCGNGNVEPGEDCDDGNYNIGDGCSNLCLWEGSNGRTSRCKNSKIEYGEQCDFGSTANNNAKNCDPTSCLWTVGYNAIEGNSKVCTSTDPGCNTNSLHIGSLANVPVCGNEKIEVGEQCDDGSNNGSSARCSASCLLSGSSGAGSTCNNGKLENGQHDSFSWVFRLSDSAEFCEDSIIETNPCPNGIWRFKASSNVASYTIKMYKGQESAGDSNCIANSEIGFWRRVWNTLVNVIRRVFGFRTVVAANYWCPVSSESYSLSDLSAMDKGNYKRAFNIGSSSTEAIAYPNEDGFRVINYIPSANFDANSEYLAVTTYTTVNNFNGTTTAKVNTYGTFCAMRDIDVEVWPKGLVKQSDGFFCNSDSDSGKPDECGRYSDDPYDDDMSASWTKDKDNSGYDLRADGSVSGSSDYKKGNQHVYRYWALGDKTGGSGRWLLRAQFVPKVFNINTKTIVEDFSNSSYSGDSWVTSGANPGKTILNLHASDSVLGEAASTTSKDFPIITYFCNNPWPDARNFPFLDNSNNCVPDGGICHNTNFGTYYCRDAGVAKACVSGSNRGNSCNSNSDCGGAEGSCQIFADDDLPSISKYDGLTGKIQGGIATGLTGADCQNLPSNFVPAMGVYYDNDADTNWGNKLYLWSTGGDLYSYATTSSQGWKRVDKGYWQQRGLPNGFKPIVGYSYDNKLELWNDRGVCKVYNGDSWSDCIKTNLPNGFVPRVGYYFPTDSNVQVWDKSGNYYYRNVASSTWVNNNTSRPSYASLGITDIAGTFKPIVAYYNASGNNLQLWDANGNYLLYSDSWQNWNANRPATSTSFRPTVAYYDSATVQLWNGQRNLSFIGEWTENKAFDKACDNKVKEFLFGRVGNLAEGSRYDFSATSTFKELESICHVSSPGSCYNSASNPTSQKRFSINSGDGSVSNNWNSILTFEVNIPKPGKYYLLTETSNAGGSLRAIPPETNLTAGATNTQVIVNNGCNIINGSIYHRIGFYFNDSLLATTSALASPPLARQITKIDQPITVSQPGNHKIRLYWDNDCSGRLAGETDDFDSNLRIYKISLVNMDAADTLDAVGIRVYANNNHYSPDKWYSDRFRLQFSGEKMIVDGYEAVNEGRTVYVGGGDLSTTTATGPTPSSPQSVFSNIYLMSFSQGASQALQNVFKQMVNNWFFNSGDKISGGLEYESALGRCEGDEADSNNYCLTDIDCLKRGKSNCDADKAKLIRDTKRLGDLQNIASQLLRFYNVSRCSNDFERSCKTNSDCYGGGTCGNYYPALKAGTYIPGKTFSVWPSWQDELGKSLSITLPADPINKFIGCSSPYASTTCWNQETKKMSCDLTSESSAYSYYSWDGGKHYQLMAGGEFSDNEKLLWRPDWNKVNNLRADPFSAFMSTFNSTNPASSTICKSFPEMFSVCQTNPTACNAALESCGNGIVDPGENCSNCWADVGCGYRRTCKPEGGGYTCKQLINCGDGVEDTLEQCDCGNNSDGKCIIGGVDKANGESGSGCSTSCQCQNGFNCSGDGDPTGLCGNGTVEYSYGEQCDFNPSTGRPTCEAVGGPNCCSAIGTTYQCRYAPITVECGVSGTSCINENCPTGYLPEAGSDCTYNSSTGKCGRPCIPDPDVYWESCSGGAVAGPGTCNLSDTCDAPGAYVETPCFWSEGTGCIMGCRASVCGDGNKELGEACDCGLAPFSWSAAINAINFNPLTEPFGIIGCESNNTDSPNNRYNNNYKNESFEYCKLNCSLGNQNYFYCGDGIRQDANGEDCDIVSYPTGSGLSGPNRCNTSDPTNQCKIHACPSGSGGINVSSGFVWCTNDNVCNGPHSVLASGTTGGANWGESKTNTCDNDCRECNASDACCNNSTCNRITSGADPDFPTIQSCGTPPTCKTGYVWNGSNCVCNTPRYVCDGTGGAVDCNGATWLSYWTSNTCRPGVCFSAMETCVGGSPGGSRGGPTSSVCDSVRTNNNSVCTPGSTQIVTNSSCSPANQCCPGERFSNKPTVCGIKDGDLIKWRIGNHGIYWNDSDNKNLRGYVDSVSVGSTFTVLNGGKLRCSNGNTVKIRGNGRLNCENTGNEFQIVNFGWVQGADYTLNGIFLTGGDFVEGNGTAEIITIQKP